MAAHGGVLPWRLRGCLVGRAIPSRGTAHRLLRPRPRLCPAGSAQERTAASAAARPAGPVRGSATTSASAAVDTRRAARLRSYQSASDAPEDRSAGQHRLAHLVEPSSPVTRWLVGLAAGAGAVRPLRSPEERIDSHAGGTSCLPRLL